MCIIGFSLKEILKLFAKLFCYKKGRVLGAAVTNSTQLVS